MMDGAGFTGNSRAVRRETAACLLTFIAWTFLWYQAGYYAGKCDAQKMSIENNGGETMIFPDGNNQSNTKNHGHEGSAGILFFYTDYADAERSVMRPAEIFNL